MYRITNFYLSLSYSMLYFLFLQSSCSCGGLTFLHSGLQMEFTTNLNFYGCSKTVQQIVQYNKIKRLSHEGLRPVLEFNIWSVCNKTCLFFSTFLLLLGRIKGNHIFSVLRRSMDQVQKSCTTIKASCIKERPLRDHRKSTKEDLGQFCITLRGSFV